MILQAPDMGPGDYRDGVAGVGWWVMVATTTTRRVGFTFLRLLISPTTQPSTLNPKPLNR